MGDTRRVVDDHSSAIRPSLYALAVGMSSPAGLWVDRAIDLACELVANGSEAPDTVSVAALSHGTRRADAEDLVLGMLREQGVPTIPPFGSEHDRFELLKQAFAMGGVPIEMFEGPFYVQVPEVGQQTHEQELILQLLDAREHETNPSRREQIDDEMRQILRDNIRAD
jgi:hypothetical protein